MANLVNLARMNSTTVGTGTITLSSAVTGFLSFADAGVTDGQTVSYAVEDGDNREVGRGVYTSAGTTLTRTVLQSTNSNNAINLSGTGQIVVTGLAQDFGMQLIERKTLSGLSTVAFTSIPQTYSHLYVVVRGKSSAGSSPCVNVTMTLNNDTGSNYDYGGRQIVNAAEGDNQGAAQTGIIMGAFPWTGATAGYRGWGEAKIFDYANSSGYKSGQWSRHSTGNTSIDGSWITAYAEGFDYRSETPITRLDLTLSAGNGTADSAAWLYGLL